MRRLFDRSSGRPRLALFLEQLEDRRVPSVGGLLSALQPPAVANPSSAPSNSGLTSLLAAPGTLLAPVTTTVQSVTTSALGGLAPAAASPTTSGTTGGLLDLNVNLSVDLLFVHLDNVHLNVGLAPSAPGQPLVSLGLGASAGVGQQTGGLLNVAPQVNVGVGGQGGAVVDVGGSGGVTLPPTVPGLPDVGGVLPPPAPPGGSGGGTQPPAPPANHGGAQNSTDNGATGNATNTGAAKAGDLGGGGQETPVAPASRITPNTGPTNANPNGQPVLATVSSASPLDPAPVLLSPPENGADGGAGAAADGGTAGEPAAPRVEDGGGAHDAPPAPTLRDGGGAQKADLAPDSAGLAMHFQPSGVALLRDALDGLFGRIAPPGGWLAGLLNRLAQWAPWLGGLVVAGVAYDLRRRRRRAARAAGKPIVE